MSKELKKFVNQRKGFQLNAHKHLKAIEQLGAQDLTEQMAAELRISVEALREYQDKLESLSSKILDLLEDDEDLEKEAIDSATYFERILSAVKMAELKLSKITTANAPGSDYGSVASKTQQNIVSKLPKLEIAPFNGDPITWQEFWDTFETSIDQRSDLSDIDKLKYLKSYLTDEAQRVVDGFRLTAANYKVVVDTLKERFANPEIAIHAHFEQLLALPSGQNEPKKLQQVYDECERHIRSLVALGLTEDTFGKVFTPIILSKIPRSIRVQLCRSNGSKPWELSRLRELMKEEIQAREMSERYAESAPATPSDKSNHTSKPKPKPRPPTQSSFARPSNDTKSKVTCCYCSKNHFADRCDVFKTVDARKGQLQGRCLRCLSVDHQLRDCKRKNVCYYCRKDNHHSSLCFEQFGNSRSIKQKVGNQNSRNQKGGPSVTQHAENSTMMHSGRHIQMQMATVRFPRSNVSARLFFDSGSSRSYATKHLVDRLGVPCSGSETISSAKFGEKRRKTETYDVVALKIPTSDCGFVQVSTLVTETICCPLTKYPIDIAANPVLQTLPLAEQPADHVESVTVDILIGQDHYFDFVGSERLSLANGMFLIQSKLGYMVTGRVPAPDGSPTDVASAAMLRLTATPDEQFERFWSLEDIGIRDSPYNSDDENALKQFNDTVRLSKDGRYEVTWPWKSKEIALPTNFGLAFGCLKSLIGRIGRDKDVMARYDSTINDQVQKQVIEPVNERDDEESGKLVHYIPHHPVVRKDKATTKLRIVYNASAKCGKNQPSLNECLLRGPVFLSDLGGMLIRFRLHPVGISCDVEKAFLQVQLQESERDVTRFLWLKNVSKPVTKSNLIKYRFRRVPFGFVSSPFLLQASIKFHLQQRTSRTADSILQNIYMDNIITGAESAEEATRFYHESKQIFAEIGMNLREWFCNSSDVMSRIRSEDRGDSSYPKVLGLTWDPGQDVLSCCSFKALPDDTELTKRSLLQTVSTIYDPCGFFTPVTILGKIMVQSLWAQKIPWDTQLSDAVADQFRHLGHDFSQLQNVKLPRRLFPDECSKPKNFELHCFCDASAKAYAAVIYLRSSNDNGNNSVAFVFSKVRLSPLKPVTLPRLELMAVVLGVRAASYVARELAEPIGRVVVWSDSKCVLHWIHSNKVLSVFVQNRINEIKSHDSFEFRYVQTAINPADLPTRGSRVAELAQSELWWHGPHFLVLSQTMWPENEFEIAAESIHEEKPKPVVALAQPRVNVLGIGNLIVGSDYSSLDKLLRVTAWVNRFVKNCRSEAVARGVGPLTSNELKAASHAWIHFAQQTSAASSKEFHQQFKHLGLFTDDSGIVRCRGRLENSSLPRGSREPVFLPKNHFLTQLTIQQSHASLFHAGVRHTLAHFRNQFWVPHGRSQVQKVVKRCVVCRKSDGGPFRVPVTPPLPQFRVTQSPPFSAVGIDYFGPLLVESHSPAAETQKTWICLFTCAATRAVHLEVVCDNSTDEFLMCLRRFSALYGAPRLIISDNAKQFKTAFDIVKSIFQSTAVQDHSASKRIEWKFIPALSPWMGGFYERLIGSVKRSMRKALQKKCLTLVQLQTIVAEVAAVVNSRPLVSNDNAVGELALTPAHFLSKSGRVGLPGPALDFDDEHFDQKNRHSGLLKKWAKGQRILEQFWASWHKEYLASLRDRPIISLNRKGASDIDVNTGVVVIIKEPQPRACWRLGRVTECHIGTDGQIRSVSVRLANGRIIQRPLKLLIPIEDAHDSGCEQPSVNSSSDERSRPPPRAAGRRAEYIIRQQAQKESSETDDELEL